MKNLIKKIVESKFNFNIDIEDNGRQNSLSKSKYNSISQKELYNLEQYIVDLDLPSGTLWCKYNLGCDYDLLFSYPEQSSLKDWYGDYYSWGETKPKIVYTWDSYIHNVLSTNGGLIKYCNNSKYGNNGYVDEYTQLLPEDDAAYQNLHIYDFNFYIPTIDQFEELKKYTTYKFIYHYNDMLGLNGIEFVSKINKNTLFIPAAGCYEYLKCKFDGIYVYTWTSNFNQSNSLVAYYYGFDNCEQNQFYRYVGNTIRPVTNFNL